jgi:hypothetical protein
VRSCANRSVQREHVAKEVASTPTVTLEFVFVTATIDAKEKRKAVTIDIPGAFLHANNEDYVISKMNGSLIKTDPMIYWKYVTIKKGRQVLYLCLQKALYGMMKSTLLFYRKLIKELKEMGFEINPYNPCVANKLVDGTKMTVRWNVDDLMISHVSQFKILKFVRHIKDIYGDNLAKNVGMTHNFLGMTFDYAFKGEFPINMCKYLPKVIEIFPEEIRGLSAKPAVDCLFNVREGGRKPNEERADVFHHTVCQQLFATNKACPDIQTAMFFLCVLSQ